MFNQFIAHTPYWVWALLVALIWLGTSQISARRVSLRRITMLPAAMAAFSLYSTISAFGVGPQVLLVWLLACAVTTTLLLQRPMPHDAQYDHASQQFSLPGSWVPLLLMMALFATKYVVGATSAMQPALVQGSGFQLGFGALYGAFSGVFLARAGRLLRLVGRTTHRPAL